MAVNTLVTGLIVFKIIKVFLKVEATTTSVERTSGLGSTGGAKLQHVIFVIIESGMALFATQLVRFALSLESSLNGSTNIPFDLIFGIAQMFNVIIRSRFLLILIY
jgi:hypothetical protein